MDAAPVVDYDKDITRLPGEEHPLERVWTISFSLGPPKRALLGIASFLSQDQIPQYLFGPAALKEKPAGNANLSVVCGPPFKFGGAIVGLMNVALVDHEAYEHFTAAVHIVYQFFPRQVNGRLMHDSWDKCRDLIQHGQVLAERFEELQARFSGLEAPAELTELLKCCGWYLFEMADHPTTLKLMDTAIKACLDEQYGIYAHFLNAIGCYSFELSDLARCRREWDKALAIREAWAKRKAPGAEEEWANQLNNYGNLESAEGNYESTLTYFSRAEIRLRLSKDAIVPLGVTYMTTGRALFLMRKYEEAIAEYKKTEVIFLNKFGKDAHFMAQCRILEKDTPLHLLLAACYYKLAVLSERDGDQEEALRILDKGLGIAEFREGKGDATRIMCKKAAILSSRSSSPEEQNAYKALQRRVEDIVLNHFHNAVYVLEGGQEEEDWDACVCSYWR
ncbi:hypothetical protein B0H67DRAFT_642220 [Lasiosphaeris hirsuta]|uniref:Uncharacterized protein n=1 Tax=Lasiosphaeris hirsuta TaxID=260670 RepID=A0AA40B1F0_9PEZI|nr:hypothetical protein B0H67DRAFT_642220 [Lasiosphaeris hirsuta]